MASRNIRAQLNSHHDLKISPDMGSHIRLHNTAILSMERSPAVNPTTDEVASITLDHPPSMARGDIRLLLLEFHIKNKLRNL